MFNLYFGNVPSVLSTLLFVGFVVYFVKTVKKPESYKKWKSAAIVTAIIGTAMSAFSGIKDSVADKMVISFDSMNLPLAVLCVLGAAAAILALVALFSRKENVNKVIFYTLSSIIIVKTLVVEVLRICNLF